MIENTLHRFCGVGIANCTMRQLATPGRCWSLKPAGDSKKIVVAPKPRASNHHLVKPLDPDALQDLLAALVQTLGTRIAT